jgi:hypothetical protein
VCCDQWVRSDVGMVIGGGGGGGQKLVK